MQAILTKYHGPTNTRGSRISAQCDAKLIFVPYDHAHDVFTNHLKAAKALAELLGWVGVYRGGSLPKHLGFAWVSGPKDFEVVLR
jgi:hypothetical protein